MSSYPKLLAAIRACLPSLGKAIKRQKQYSYEMIGKMLEDRWASAEPLRAEEPAVQVDEQEPPA